MEPNNNKLVKNEDTEKQGEYYYKVPSVAVASAPHDEQNGDSHVALIAVITAVLTALVCFTVCGTLMLLTGTITIGAMSGGNDTTATVSGGASGDRIDAMSGSSSSLSTLSTLSQSTSYAWSSYTGASGEINQAAESILSDGDSSSASSAEASEETDKLEPSKDSASYGKTLPYINSTEYDIGLPIYRDTEESDAEEETAPAPSDGAPDSFAAAMSVSKIVKSVMPWVVSVISETSNYFGVSMSGSGVVISDDGYIVTNQHIVSDAESIAVVLPDGTNYAAKLIGSDASTDLAVLKIFAKGLPCASIGNSDELEVGDVALAVGNPYGLNVQSTVTCGIISGLNRSLSVDDSRVSTFIKTDASINYGNSGGPLVNIDGKVIGVCSQTISENNDGLGYAIPINSVMEIVDELVLYGKIKSRVSIGIQAVMISEDYSKLNGIPVGLRITGFTSELPINAGLRRGDIITAMNGVEITSLSVYNEEKSHYQAGVGIIVTVYRDTANDGEDGKELDISVVMVEQE